MPSNKSTNGTNQPRPLQQKNKRRKRDKTVWYLYVTDTATSILSILPFLVASCATWRRHGSGLWILTTVSIVLLGLMNYNIWIGNLGMQQQYATTSSSNGSSQNKMDNPRMYPSLRRVLNQPHVHPHDQPQVNAQPQQQQQLRHAIPNILIFTHRWNLWNSKEIDWNTIAADDEEERHELQALQSNVHRIAALHSTAQIRFLTDDDCRTSLRRLPLLVNNDTERLVHYFDHETQGMFKADLCRGAALYETGGIYLDVDLGVRLNLWDVLNTTTEFATVKVHKQSKYPGAFFQAFLAATPHHPVLLRYVELFLKHYQGTLQPEPIKGGPLGVLLLKRAYDEIEAEQRQVQAKPREEDKDQDPPLLEGTTSTTTKATHLNSTTELWQEALYLPELRNTLLRDIPPPTWGTRRACKFIVIARPTLPLQVPMYSRIAGSRMCPENSSAATHKNDGKGEADDPTTSSKERDGAHPSDRGNVNTAAKSL